MSPREIKRAAMIATSLRDQILNAGSFPEIEELMKRGAGYRYASRNTRHKWELAVKARGAFLLAAAATRNP